MNYTQYNQESTWGSQEYRLRTPPTPTYEPQSSWSGLEFYRAHAGTTDHELYDSAVTRMKELADIDAGDRFKSQAVHSHRMIYTGLTDVKTCPPTDIGAAAAYEAWRSWKSHPKVYVKPIENEPDSQREALIGIAIGEAAGLYTYTGNPINGDECLDTVGSAATTTSRIFSETWEISEGLPSQTEDSPTKRNTIP